VTDTTELPPPAQPERIEPVDLQASMQRNYIEYAMSVIVGRALPDVRDGLKPVHTRILYAMYDGGYRPDRGFFKCARVVGDVIGTYHPHGDTAVYDTLARLAQPWAMRYPLVDGQGNFGSSGDDKQAAMRYCVTGDTRVRTFDNGAIRIADLVPGAEPNSDHDVDLKLMGKDGVPVHASKFFHSGSHPTLKLRTVSGHELTGTHNHPVLCLVDVGGVPTLLWKLLEEVRPGDYTVMQHIRPPYVQAGDDEGPLPDYVPFLGTYLREQAARSDVDRAWLLGTLVDRLGQWEHGADEVLARITDEGASIARPLTDGRFAYAEVASVIDAGVQPVYSLRVDSEDHAFITNGFVSHNTECRMAPLAMEMLRDINEDTVDFRPNYDGRDQEPVVLPARFPNLLVNGSPGGIAVGMATNIPPHNLREVAAGVQWALAHPEATREELFEALIERIPGPDFPTAALIVGRRGIEEAYRTGRGSVTMRAVVDVEEDRGRTSLVVTELPYQVNPDSLARRIAELVNSGKMGGIAELRDDSSSRTGQRLVITLKRDAVAKVVLNNLYKHTALQDTFGCNMLALVDGVPRTLTLDQFVSYWIEHQIEVIQRRTRYRLRRAEEEAHLYRGLVKALDALDEVIALIRRSQTVEEARDGLIQLLDIDELQARHILDMQLRRLAALERQKIIDHLQELEAQIADLNDILASPERQRQIIADELGTIVDKFGDDRRSQIIPADGDLTAADLIPDEDVVVTITMGGYAKRTQSGLYRSQRRGGKGVRGAQLRGDDVVNHLFPTRNHHWILFFTNRGRVYRAKAYELPEAGRDAKGGHVAGLLSFQPDEEIAQVLAISDYEQAPYLVLATKKGLIKKTPLKEYDSNRAAGIIALNFREEDDELIGAHLVGPDDDLLLVSKKAMAVRFQADDGQLRPMGRATSGVTGMRFRDSDELLALGVIRHDEDEQQYVFTVTNGGYAKRTVVEEYRKQGRGGLGIKAMRITDSRGSLVGAIVVGNGDEVLCVKASGQVTRSPVSDVPAKGRDTMGVIFAGVKQGDSVVAIARNAEHDAGEENADEVAVDQSTEEGDDVSTEVSSEGSDEQDRTDSQEDST
jgi:DNA gyrase subunit A